MARKTLRDREIALLREQNEKLIRERDTAQAIGLLQTNNAEAAERRYFELCRDTANMERERDAEIAVGFAKTMLKGISRYADTVLCSRATLKIVAQHIMRTAQENEGTRDDAPRVHDQNKA